MSEQQGKYATETEDSLNNARAMIGWDRPIEIQDDSDLKKYRIELPNLYDDAGLDPYEFRLLAHYKRVGTCTEGSNTTAKFCLMSPAQVSVKRQSLRKKGFIRMQKITMSDKEYSYRITIIDRWQENFNKYYTPSPHEAPPSPHELKKEEEAVNIFSVYQAEIGLITAFIADTLQDWEKTVPAQWIVDAIHEAAANNKRNMKYIDAILKRWHAQGNQDCVKKQEVKPQEYTPVYSPTPERIKNPRPANVPAPKIAGMSS